MSINLLYHDVTPAGADDSSGFAGPEAARYKLTPDEFSAHLNRIKDSVTALPLSNPVDLANSTNAWTITFDDGGLSNATLIAEELEQRGWRGWFFVATDFIDRPTFCSREQIRDLHERGHVIGSHSCSHPERISSCSTTQILDEWSRSCEVLAEIIGQPVTTASVPGGFYSTEVARAAARAGIKVLFTSEPTVHVHSVDHCRVVGRYNIYRGMQATDATLLLTSRFRRWRQAACWSAKKAAKTVAGPVYKAVRRRLLSRAYS